MTNLSEMTIEDLEGATELASVEGSFGQYDNPSVKIVEQDGILYLIEDNLNGTNVFVLADVAVRNQGGDESNADYAKSTIDSYAANMIDDSLAGGYLIADRYAWGIGDDEINDDEDDDTMVSIIEVTEYYSHTAYSCVDGEQFKETDNHEWAKEFDRDGEIHLALAREIVAWLEDDSTKAYGCPVLGNNQSAATRWMICKY